MLERQRLPLRQAHLRGEAVKQLVRQPVQPPLLRRGQHDAQRLVRHDLVHVGREALGCGLGDPAQADTAARTAAVEELHAIAAIAIADVHLQPVCAERGVFDAADAAQQLRIADADDSRMIHQRRVPFAQHRERTARHRLQRLGEQIRRRSVESGRFGGDQDGGGLTPVDEQEANRLPLGPQRVLPLGWLGQAGLEKKLRSVLGRRLDGRRRLGGAQSDPCEGKQTGG